MAEANANKGPVFYCENGEEWDKRFNKANSQKLVVVEFTAKWCGPCKLIAPTLKTLAEKTIDVLFLEVDVDKLREVADKYKVEEMPTFVFIKNGEELGRVVGALQRQLRDDLKKYASSPVSA